MSCLRYISDAISEDGQLIVGFKKWNITCTSVTGVKKGLLSNVSHFLFSNALIRTSVAGGAGAYPGQ